MGDSHSQKIIIGNKIITREEVFEKKERFRKEQAKLSFEAKIETLVSLQEIAYSWGEKKDVIVWKL